jgi:hypothetical protein
MAKRAKRLNNPIGQRCTRGSVVLADAAHTLLVKQQ